MSFQNWPGGMTETETKLAIGTEISRLEPKDANAPWTGQVRVCMYKNRNFSQK